MRKKKSYPLTLIEDLKIDIQEDEEYLFDHFEENFQALETKKVSNSITEREFKCINLYYKEDLTLEEVGKKLGITKSRAQAIIRKALTLLNRYQKVFIYGYKNYLINKTNEKLTSQLLQKQRMLKENLEKNDFEKNIYIECLPDVTIEELDFSVRTYNALKRAKLNMLKDIASLSLYELNQIRNIGKKSVCETIEKLKEYNITIH